MLGLSIKARGKEQSSYIKVCQRQVFGEKRSYNRPFFPSSCWGSLNNQPNLPVTRSPPTEGPTEVKGFSADNQLKEMARPSKSGSVNPWTQFRAKPGSLDFRNSLARIHDESKTKICTWEGPAASLGAKLTALPTAGLTTLLLPVLN